MGSPNQISVNSELFSICIGLLEKSGKSEENLASPNDKKTITNTEIIKKGSKISMLFNIALKPLIIK